jgi:hypothetical protein
VRRGGSSFVFGLLFDDDQPVQDALFRIEGPDEDGCVWVRSAEGHDVWCNNLGTKGAVRR